MQSLRPTVDLVPYARTLRVNFASSVGTRASAGAVSQLLRAVHRAGKRSVAEYALAALITAEDRLLENLLRPENGIVEYRIAQELSRHKTVISSLKF